MQRNETQRTVAVCANCGTVCAANVDTDGSIRSIGQPAGCHCGESEYVRADSLK